MNGSIKELHLNEYAVDVLNTLFYMKSKHEKQIYLIKLIPNFNMNCMHYIVFLANGVEKLFETDNEIDNKYAISIGVFFVFNFSILSLLMIKLPKHFIVLLFIIVFFPGIYKVFNRYAMKKHITSRINEFKLFVYNKFNRTVEAKQSDNESNSTQPANPRNIYFFNLYESLTSEQAKFIALLKQPLKFTIMNVFNSGSKKMIVLILLAHNIASINESESLKLFYANSEAVDILNNLSKINSLNEKQIYLIKLTPLNSLDLYYSIILANDIKKLTELVNKENYELNITRLCFILFTFLNIYCCYFFNKVAIFGHFFVILSYL